MMRPPLAHRERLLEQGYTVLEGLLRPEEVSALREAVLALVADIAPPRMQSPETTPLDERSFVSASGLGIPRLLRERPDLRPLVLSRRLLEVVGSVLGAGMRVEIAGASVSDASRPFFRWHSHVDGEDEGVRFSSKQWPRVPDVRRVLTLLYLDDLNDDTGPLFVLPRRAGDPTEPPYSIDLEEWPGQIELRPRAGTAVAIDQCTWHAARSMRGPGLRTFLGCYFAAAHAVPMGGADPGLTVELEGPST